MPSRRTAASSLPNESPTKRIAPDDRLERELLDAGERAVAGVDEAGRGPLAGPVFAAAVILDWTNCPAGLNDSKKLTARRREILFQKILATSAVAISSASPQEIDRHNIRGATLIAMRRAVLALAEPASFVLIDGRDVPPGLPVRARAVVSGDTLSLSVAAASIVAKVARDRTMRQADRAFPGYGFAGHMGYGTAAHLEALARLGPCPLHRRSFRPVRESEGVER